MTLLQLHSARSMSHAAYHAKEKRKPSKTNAGAVLKEVRRRVQEGLELESQKAIRAEGHAGSRGARALFLTQRRLLLLSWRGRDNTDWVPR